MNPRLRAALEVIAFIAVVTVLWIVVPVGAQGADDGVRRGSPDSPSAAP